MVVADSIAWSGVMLGLIVIVGALVGITFTWRALQAQRATGAVAAGPPLTLLVLSIVGLAGLLLAIWSLNLSGNLGR